LNTAINLIKLCLLIVMGLLYLTGQGWLLVGPLLHGSLTVQRSKLPLLQIVPLVLLSGLITNYGLILALQSLKISLITGVTLSLVGLGCFLIYLVRYHLRQNIDRASISRWLGSVSICLLFLGPILVEPLKDWDARSIWFFHAKMIYYAGSLSQGSGWQYPSVAFSHVDYPDMVPAMAAQVAFLAGFWNEYLPKIALLFMLIPAVIWLFTFARRSFSFLVLLLLLPLSLDRWMWNGFMDGYLALYFALALLLFGRYVQTAQPVDLLSGVGCLMLLFNIKNEGALAVLTGLTPLFFFLLRKKKPVPLKTFLLANGKYFLAGFMAVVPFILWTFYKSQWNLSNNLGIGTPQSFVRIIDRLKDGSYQLILQNMAQELAGALLLLGLLLVVSAAWRKPVTRECLPALISASLYCLGCWSFTC
jgi:hypothetical protein